MDAYILASSILSFAAVGALAWVFCGTARDVSYVTLADGRRQERYSHPAFFLRGASVTNDLAPGYSRNNIGFRVAWSMRTPDG